MSETNSGVPILPTGMTNEVFYKEQAEYWKQIAREDRARIQELESELASCRECRAKIDCLSRGAVPVRDDGAEILVGLTAVIQYRNKRELGPWKTMAAFDVMGPAEKYFADQRTEADWPWEYRLVDLNEDTAK